jgi:methionine-S-sulfoxide reductase
MKKIILAGGCFWGVEAYYSKLKGVVETTVGYTDGPAKNPSYKEVCSDSGHVEAVLVKYDETVIPLSKILEHFFRIVDVTEKDQQGHDVGIQYRNAIFFFDSSDEPLIRQALDLVKQKIKKPVFTIVKEATPFYDAENYHQDYLDKNPTGYCHINMNLIRPDERK